MKIHISVTNDLVTDQRVHKIAMSLQKEGHIICLIGRKLNNSLSLKRPYYCHRMKLFFNKGFLFYAEYNLRLFFYLLFQKTDVLLANDLDSLLANFLVSKLRNKKLVYDSHEYFTELPELVQRPKVKKIWLNIEKKILPKIKYSYTVCDSIAKIYSEKYKINMGVVRNLPILKKTETKINLETKNEIQKIIEFTQNKKIILYQGSINIGRGLDYAIKSMKFIDNAILLILGKGTILNDLIELSKNLNLENKVYLKALILMHEFVRL